MAPSVGVSRGGRRWVALGFVVLAAASPSAAQVLVTLRVDGARIQGAHASGQPLLFSPDPVQPGSSISHWDPTASPDLLMEPALTPDLPFLGLDISPAQMRDIGWPEGTSSFRVLPIDPDGVGFTDPRPFAGAPGNPAATLGEARVNLFNAVLGAWGSVLASSVEIDVIVAWRPLFCEEGAGAVLGAAAPLDVFSGDDFPHADTWYHAPLAEALSGEDLTGEAVADPEEPVGDIFVFLNASIDEECLAPGTGYYYGLDGENPTELLDLAPVVLHELGHGLGMSNFGDERSGRLLADQPSIFDRFTFDHDQGKSWDAMSDDERRRSAVNPRRVSWSGAEATAAAAATLQPGVPELLVTAPASIAGLVEIGPASFGPGIPAEGLSGEVACFVDEVADPSLLNGCTPAASPGNLAGKIALVERGQCPFVAKVANAQAAGAIAAIVVNNAGSSPPNLGGDDPEILIPAISVGRRDGAALRRAACPESAALVSGGRFQVSAQWRDFEGVTGPAAARELTADTATFTFFDPANIELLAKVIDACGDEEFETFWLFAAGLTNLEVTLTVVDTQTGVTRSYASPLGEPFAPIQDTGAFATCP